MYWDLESYSSAEKLNSALRKAHDCIDQSGKYKKKCINCFNIFNNNNNDYNTLGCLQHKHNRKFFNEGNLCDTSEMKTSLRWACLFSKNTLHHQVKHAYQMTPTQFLAIRNRLTSSSPLIDCTYWTMIFLGSHLFLCGFEICDILLKNLDVSEVEFEDDKPWLVKRVKLGVWRKGNCFTNFQISREDGFPKLCLVRQLLVYIHCCNIDVINNGSETPLFRCVENASRKLCKETFSRYLESLSKDVLGIPDDIRGLTIHSLRNMGYVLSKWGDGAIEDAIYDANHSPTAKSYEKYTRDTSLKYNNWKTDNHVSSAVSVLVPMWKKKQFLATKFMTRVIWRRVRV